MYKTIVLTLVLALLFVPTVMGQKKLFPTSLDYGKVDPSGRFETAPVVPKESLPTQVMSPDNSRFKVDLDKLLDPVIDELYEVDASGSLEVQMRKGCGFVASFSRKKD